MTTTVLPAVGLHPNVPFAQYCAWDAVNIHRLMPLSDSPLHCKHEMDNPKPTSKAMLLGLALHAAVFEPATLHKEFIVIPQFDCGTKDGKLKHIAAIEAIIGKTVPDGLKKDEREALVKETGKTVLTDEELRSIERMGESIRANPLARKYIDAPGATEVCALWRDPATQLACKGRFDKKVNAKAVAARPVIVELKTARSVDEWRFAKDIAEFGYAEQSEFYLTGDRSATGDNALHLFIVVENTEPHDVDLFALGDESRITAAATNRRWLDTYSDCLVTGQWPGRYSGKPKVIEMPRYALERKDA